MSTESDPTSEDSSGQIGDPERETNREIDYEELKEEVEELRREVSNLKDDTDGEDQKKMTIIATKGSLDMAYPPLILASTAAAFGWDVIVFHTFWGLDILHEDKSKNLKLSAVGNPSMSVPNAFAALPGMDSMATKMMNRKIDKNGTPSIEELIETSLDTGVELQACQMTIELMEYDEDDFYDGVTVGVGAATALDHMGNSDIQLLI